MSILDKSFDFLVSLVGQQTVDKWRQESNIENHLDNLHSALSKARDLIRRSECWRLKYKRIDNLMSMLKDAIYEAEIIVDQLEHQRLKYKVEKSSPGRFLVRYFKSWIIRFPEKIKEASNNLYEYCAKMEQFCSRFQIPEIHHDFTEITVPVSIRCDNTSNVNLYGRDKDLDDLIRLLGVYGCRSCGIKRKRKQKGNVSIISIIGSGGVGKTTLAQMVYNDTCVKEHFEKLMWVRVSKNFYIEMLTNEIIKCVRPSGLKSTNKLDSLQRTLQRKLKSKKFLLVLDDAWSDRKTDWQCLLRPMIEGIQGSVVLITTRSRIVAEAASNNINSMGSIYYLEGVEKNIYWKFFKSCAFGLEEKTQSYPELKQIGKQISEKLHGSPFGAKIIGSLLKVKLDVNHWKNSRDDKILKQLIRDKHDIMPILQLSYHYLPSDLKKCFSFCSLYPKDFKFTKIELSKFWIMHGFINPSENVQHDQHILADVYFDELVRRCIFQKATGRLSDEYVIPDVMHDLCQSITKDAGNYLSRTIRYWCQELTSIRSLSLVKCNLKKLPENIGKLKHLQYLDISFSKIEELPNSFCSLYNLKYLYMEGCSSYIANNFPEGSDKLVSLQNFCFPRMGMPLEGLVNNHAKKIIAKDLTLDLRNGGTIIDKIQNLKHINIRGSLSINNLEVVPSKEAAEEAELHKKPLVKSLCLSWSWPWEYDRDHTNDHSVSNDNHDGEVLEGLCPHPNLKELWITNYGGVNLSPSWLKNTFWPNLTELRIWSCDQLTNLDNGLRPEHLPALKGLHLLDCKEIMLLPVTSFGRFEALERLEISHCPKLICPKAMVLPPSIKYLCLRSCGNLLKTIPSCLQNLSSLEKLILENFPVLVSIPAETTSQLESLSSLRVVNCAMLQSLGGLWFLASLKKLYILSCPLLEETGGQNITGRLPPELVAKAWDEREEIESQ